MNRRHFNSAVATLLGAASLRGGLAQDAAQGNSDSAQIPGFSAMPLGEPSGSHWREQRLSGVTPNQWTVLDEAGNRVLRSRSARSASSLMHVLPTPLAVGQPRSRLLIHWRWKVSGFPAGAEFATRAGDDFAARVYVMFDYPLQKISAGQRLLIRMARTIHGDDVPAAVLCYVWHPQAAANTLVDSPYSSRVKMIVARSSSRSGVWYEEQRNLVADFQRAFGEEFGAGIAPVRAIAVASDSDQTGSEFESWFSDVRLTG